MANPFYSAQGFEIIEKISPEKKAESNTSDFNGQRQMNEVARIKRNEGEDCVTKRAWRKRGEGDVGQI